MQFNMSYFNTLGEKGEQLEMYQKKATSQDKLILHFFKQTPRINYTPSQVWRMLFKEQVPLTSVRRSISNLTNEGHLKQCEERREGVYGRSEGTWIVC